MSSFLNVEPTTDSASNPSDENSSARFTRRWRSEMLAAAEGAALIRLADRCLEGGETRLIDRPVVGTVSLCVREPVVGERFLVADVLATKAEVDHRGVRGWAMRLGDDPAATVAAAICDAEACADTERVDQIDALCLETQRRKRELDAAEWAELLPTQVRFEELK